MNTNQSHCLSDDIKIWCIPLHQPSSVVHELEEYLSADERLRATRFRRDFDRQRYIIAHGALRELLAGYTNGKPSDLQLETSATGQPALLPKPGQPDVRFSLTHSVDWAAVAISHVRVGIDIEKIDRHVNVAEIARRFFTVDEAQTLTALPEGKRLQGFFTMWTRKEAYLKACGDGIANRLSSFSVSIDPMLPAALLSDAKNPSAVDQWMFRDLNIAEGYVAALAVEGVEQRIQVNTWRDPSSARGTP